MSAHGDSLPHYVTVTAQPDPDGDPGEYLEPQVTFECKWLYGACHFYPECDCEYFTPDHYAEHGPGHEAVHHDQCWMEDWFGVIESTAYQGEDYDDMTDSCIPRSMNRAGAIDLSFEYDVLLWEFKESTP